jgi:D-inositol-3-phosphate glycosyltransferase
MNIALVSEHANPLASVGGVDAGGQNVHVAELAGALAARGHRVRVYSRRDRSDLPERLPLARGAEVVHVPAGPAVTVGKDELLPYMREFGRFLAADWAYERPDAVHAHFWMSGLAATAAAGPAGIPVLQTFHALGSVKRRHQGAADASPAERVRLETALSRQVDAVLATSTDELTELARLGMPPGAATVIPCGVDATRFSPDGPAVRGRSGRRRLVSVGRLVPRKGYDLAIRALVAVPDAELVIAGGPAGAALGADPEAARLRALADRLGVADRVVLAGQVARADVPALLRGADALVCTPWYEPFGMVALEAMACGLPVVAAAVGGLTDTVLDGGTGALVPPRDPAALAAALRRLLADPVTLARYRTDSVARARARYTWPRIAADTEAAYVRAIRGTPIRAVEIAARDDAQLEVAT